MALTGKEKADYMRAWRIAHRDERAAYGKMWRAAHCEELSAYSAIYEAAHRDERAAYKKAHKEERSAYCNAHREERAAYYAAYHATNKDMRAACSAAWAKAHPQERAAYQTAYRKAHPQERAEKCRRRKALKRGATIGKVDLEAIKIRDRMRCCICGRRVNEKLKYPHPYSLSFDHSHPLILGGPHSQENQRVAHLRCNFKRHTGRLPVQMVLV